VAPSTVARFKEDNAALQREIARLNKLLDEERAMPRPPWGGGGGTALPPSFAPPPCPLPPWDPVGRPQLVRWSHHAIGLRMALALKAATVAGMPRHL